MTKFYPMLRHEIFQTPFCNNNYLVKKLFIYFKLKENIPAGGTPETHTLRKHLVVEYLNGWFW